MACICVVLCGGALLLWPHLRHTDIRLNGALPSDAYVWQRNWNTDTRDAIGKSQSQLHSLVALGAEVSFRNGRPIVVSVPVDWALLQKAHGSAGAALRIGPYTGPFAATDATCRLLCDLAESQTSNARRAGVTLAELQIDFDCPTSKLHGYQIWVESIRQRIAPVKLTITALPTWLADPAALPLLRATDGFVLQVHSLEKPAGIDAPMTLCDPVAAKAAVERAESIGVPFRVALPTYGYLAAFSDAGELLGISAEGPSRTWPAGVRLKVVRSDPVVIAGLVREWTVHRPPHLVGIIWYRLPCDEDQLNWRAETLACVMRGKTPSPHLVVEVRRSEARLDEVTLRNDGSADALLPENVRVRCDDAEIIASDALGGFEQTGSTVESAGSEVTFRATPAGGADVISPGQTRSIGWVRLSADKEVHADVAPSLP
jgi:hypothetical protein